MTDHGVANGINVRLFLVGFLLFTCASTLWAQHQLVVTVRDDKSKKPIDGASLFISETRSGGKVDSLGVVTLWLAPNVFTIYVSAVGYIRDRVIVTLDTDKRIDVYLKMRSTTLDEVDVRAIRPDNNIRAVQMGQVQLSMPELKRMPVVLGEPDILKALTLQAGVTTAGEGAGGFNVRGGRADQNLVLLDGAPLFNTAHLLGFFTNVNPDLMQDVSLSKGAFSAQYGGRVSSLLTMSTRNGNAEGWRVSGGISPVSLRVVADGPVAKKLTLIAGGRVAFPNYLLQLFPTPSVKNSRASFYDANLKLTYTPTTRHTVGVSLYQSGDSFRFPGDTLYGWQSTVVTGRWNYLIRPAMQLSVTGLYSGYRLNVNGITPRLDFNFRSSIAQREGKVDLVYTPDEKLRVQAGANGILYRVQTGTLQPASDASSINPLAINPENGREFGVYISTDWMPSPAVTVQAGLRYSAFAYVGAATVYQYAEGVPRSPETVIDSVRYGPRQVVQQYGGLEPRFNLRLRVAANTAIKVSIARNRQYLSLISNTTAITPLDFWKLSDTFTPPQIADQVAIGFFQNGRNNAIEIGLEAYYKRLQNQIDYRYGANLVLNPHLETALVQATGKAYGVEASLAKRTGRLTGQITYAYARSLIAVQTPFDALRINGGRYYPAYIDRPHTLNVQSRLSLSHNWIFSANFVYYTGVPATYPDGRFNYNGETTLDYSQRNADRIPDYHRLDIAFSKDTRFAKNQRRYGIWTLGIYNVYARKNPYSIYFTRSSQRVDAYRLSVFGTLIPSIAYNAYF